jgi:glyoxylase-like metal-dependent hydrolase (beta-lactamase superfamily II)
MAALLLVQQIPVRETNCYLLRGDGGAVLIDAGPPGSAAAVRGESDSRRHGCPKD